MRLDAKRNRGDGTGPSGRGSSPLFVTVQPDGSDLWRLDPIIRMLQEGAVEARFHFACRTFWSHPCGCKRLGLAVLGPLPSSSIA